jgi:hypothetical protein
LKCLQFIKFQIGFSESIEVLDYKPGEICTGRKTIQGISTLSYIKNMRVLMGYVD